METFTPRLSDEVTINMLPTSELQDALDRDEFVASRELACGAHLVARDEKIYVAKVLDKDRGLREALAGLLVANTFRDEIPNFFLTHAYRSYEDRDVIISEYIEGVPLHLFLMEYPYEECKKVVLSIIYSLDFAHQRGFTHYDPKPMNIIVRDNGEEISINYGEKVMKTRYIPVFIDLGVSSFSYEGKRYGIEADDFCDARHNPMADFQRFIYALRKVLHFFSSEGTDHLEMMKKLMMKMTGSLPYMIIDMYLSILPPESYVMTPSEVVEAIEEIFA